MTSIIEQATAAAQAVVFPPPDLTVSQWADEFRRLSSEAAAEPGRWHTDRAPYQRGIMDALNDPDIHTIVVMSSAQVGKTEILLNIIGYYVHQDPSPMLCLQPTLDMAEAFSKDRLAPMVRDTPALTGKIADPKARDSGNTLLHKKFAGGHITMSGANSPASLASRPIRVVLCDEVDRYPVSAAAEGDPVNLAKKRTTTFWNRKVVLTSTPTIKDMSRIQTAYEGSDQRVFHVPCPHCGHQDRLTWERVKWDDDPKAAAVVCLACGGVWSEAQRKAAVRRGHWVTRAPHNGIAGFHLSEIYSPWSSPADMAVAFLEAKHAGTEMLQTWVNTALGEPWEEEGETVSHHALMARRETFDGEIPEKVAVLTMGCDVQQDRIEAEIVGWTAEQESWSIDYLILAGDPAHSDVWQDLAEVIRGRYATADGRQLSIATTCIDSGYLPKRVYEFGQRIGTQVLPTKGMPGTGRPIVETGIARLKRLRKRKTTGVRPELVGVDEGKILLYRRLMQQTIGPGYCHFPTERDEEYFAQLTAEKLVTRYRKGRPILEWVAQRPRNEALDCRVLAHAALLLFGTDKIPTDTKPVPAAPPPARKRPPPARRQIR